MIWAIGASHVAGFPIVRGCFAEVPTKWFHLIASMPNYQNMVYDLERKLSADHSKYSACGTCPVLTSCCYKIEVQVHTAFLTPCVQMTSWLKFASKTFSIITDGWSGHRYFGLFLIVFLLNVVLKCISHSFCI